MNFNDTRPKLDYLARWAQPWLVSFNLHSPQQGSGVNLSIAFFIRVSLIIVLFCSLAATQIGAEITVNQQRPFRPRIIGGVDVSTTPQSVAMLVYQGNTSRYYGCAGSLISPDKVITAGHCVDDRIPVEVILGRNKISDSERGEVHAIASIAIHPRFSVRTLENDLAIITLDKASALPPLPIATRSMLNNLTYDSELTVQGWGYTNPDFLYPSDILKQAIIRYIPRYVCNSSLFYDKLIGPGMLCAGFVEGGADSCGGDSGGPLTLDFQDQKYLLGTVSWGASEACGQARRPGVYTDVTYYQNWIQQQIYDKAALPNILRLAPKRSATVGIGDLDGDGVKEIISLVGNRLNISSGEGKRSTPLRLRKLRGKKISKFDIVDVDGNYRDDIVITTGNTLQILSLKDTLSLGSPTQFNVHRSFTIRKITLPQSTPIIDSSWGHILSSEKAQLAILTRNSVMVLAVDFTTTRVEFTTTITGGKSLLVGSIDEAPLDSVYVFDGNMFKNVFLAGEAELTISSGQTIIDAPQDSFLYDIDGDGINELLSITPSGRKTSMISVARFDGVSFGKFSPWFEVPKGSVLAI